MIKVDAKLKQQLQEAPLTLDVKAERIDWGTAKPYTPVSDRDASRPSVAPTPFPVDGPGSREFSLTTLIALAGVIPAALIYAMQWPAWLWPLVTLVCVVPIFAAYMMLTSRVTRALSPVSAVQRAALPARPITDYIKFNKPELAARYRGYAKIPMEVLFEAYIAGDVDFCHGSGDVLDAMEARHDFCSFGLTFNQAKFFLTQWLPETLWHSREQDETQVRDHYDRGDDFYAAFLGPAMIYTSGIMSNPQVRESLEQLQDNKLRLVCEKIRLKEGEKMLDIGCGWGTLVSFAAKNYNAHATGVTLAKNQAAFCKRRAEALGVGQRVTILCHDYRDIPRQNQYDKITCLEMAEHVGVRKFHEFLGQIQAMLSDNGLFFLQIAGLRRPWQYEDLNWGLFMAKYVFPGADASCPLAWVVNQLECAGFEVQSIDTIGVHYSATIERWYRNWMQSRAYIESTYGGEWFRKWAMFLAWSVISSRQGSATCYQIVSHKNVNAFARESLITSKRLLA